MLPPSTPAQFAWANTFQHMMKEVVAGLPTAQQPDSGIFSPACFHHCVTDAEGFWGLKINGVSFKDAFTEWFEQGKAPLHIVDPCTCAGARGPDGAVPRSRACHSCVRVCRGGQNNNTCGNCQES